jgi:hypothetical protein
LFEITDGMYWGDGDNTPACANAVETTAYALLAMISFDDIKNSSSIVRWLTTQRNAAGAFRTTQVIIYLHFRINFDIYKVVFIQNT